MLVKSDKITYKDKEVPVIDSARAHINAAVDVYLGSARINALGVLESV